MNGSATDGGPASLSFTHPVASSAGVRERLAAFSLTPKKSLGQNFLTDASALNVIRESIPEECPVYEIGPGLGAITQDLLARGRRVLAVEKDAAMAGALRHMADAPGLTLVHGDALHLSGGMIRKTFADKPFWIVGNLPYYITTPLVSGLITAGMPIAGMTLMVQREAAERFFCAPGSRVYGPLTVCAALQFHMEKLCSLSPASFFPEPAVHSVVVRFKAKGFALPDGFAQFLTALFAMRRKTAQNNLIAAGYAGGPARTALCEAGVPADIRACAMEPLRLLRLYTCLP